MKNEEIERLLQKFFDGETNNQEEQILHNFFNEVDVPPHLIGYKKEFRTYNRMLTKKPNKNDHSIQARRNMSIKKIAFAVGIAACLIGFAVIGLNSLKNETLNIFEGSYISYGNTVITDLKIIQPELEKDLQHLLEKEREINELVSHIENIYRNNSISTSN